MCGLWQLRPDIVTENQCWHAGTQLVVLPLAFIGGLGMPVILEIYHRLVRRMPLSKNTMAVLQMSAWVYLIALVALLR